MNCPMCDTDMTLIDYDLSPKEDQVIQKWEYTCPCCHYHAVFGRLYTCTQEWEERIENDVY